MTTGRGKFGDRAHATVERARAALIAIECDHKAGILGLGGVFDVECWMPNGRLRWHDIAKNALTSAGLDSVLNVYLRAATQITTWYMMLVDNAGFTAYSSADVMSSHAGWAENQDYTGATRPVWSPGAPSANAVVNGTTVDFAMNATKTIRGLAIASLNDKGGTTGTLFSAASFSGGNQAVNSGDTLKVTYTVSATAT